jgi:Rrf2 family protein
MAEELGVSYNHLSKIMQRLTKAGFVSPLRGPKGGFALTPKCGDSELRDILESLDGPMNFSNCLMKTKVYGRGSCVFSGFISDTNRRFEKMLSRKVSDFTKDR